MPLPYEIQQMRLPNGLRVVINPDPLVPLVAVNLWVGVGSRHEHPGRTGFAHLFEHLMFQGSANVAEGEHFAALMAQGARLNATTSFDRTNYFETVPTGALELALWLEADRHGNLLPALTQENFDNQRDVVKEEKRQRYDNVPYGTWMAELCALVFPPGHPYSHVPIGSMADLESSCLKDAHAFYTAHYRPSNTVLTLAGDVTVDKATDLAATYFGHLTDPDPALISTHTDSPPLPPIASPIRSCIHADVPHERLYIAFRLPREDTSRAYLGATLALDALGGLGMSRLDMKLVRDTALANSVSVSWMGLTENTSLGFITVQLEEGTDPAHVEDIICAELEALGTHGPTEDELISSNAFAEYGWLSTLAGLTERADALNHYATLHGDATGAAHFLDRLALISSEDVTAAARHWLNPQHRAVLHYIPRARPQGQPGKEQA
ncbi:M16 family metallopeptidase [Dermatophilus congolensis]|uniref:M16 family metallopeptidase n=1 Tax=Dermatophilus congolensis TaxID=1863 RepID=UPI001AAF5334|nr:pitrilysin family protein [Dermatophilus congolensis]MBO3143075.1 insulinase family protein [Dermatophilus congolensis]MBO3152064.1 insulinase family protein [Dermatophilus congolensis]MBO3160924.1 insulinase family protein [Dermatophilus congolensis]MBO3163350.1 insulinase family protein [Dermatophilus congolensis]MBO3176903.1 insulinase family protein [Dermatophilus congolensis]